MDNLTFYYINLKHRIDRDELVQNELLKLGAKKIKRIEACFHDKGYIGCTMSHIKALELFLETDDEICCIVEDDIEFKSNACQKMAKFLANFNMPWDVYLLTSSIYCRKTELLKDDIHKVITCLTTTGYIVTRKYSKELLHCFKKSLRQQFMGIPQFASALDVCWQTIQKTGNWYISMPVIAVQRPGYSDIEKKVTNFLF